MDAVSFLEALHRLCADNLCSECALRDLPCPENLYLCHEAAEVVRAVEEWAQQNPPPKDKPVKIVADELVRVFTIRVNITVKRVGSYRRTTDRELRAAGQQFCAELQRVAIETNTGPFDDALCVNADETVGAANPARLLIVREFTIELTDIRAVRCLEDEEEEQPRLEARGNRVCEEVDSLIKRIYGDNDELFCSYTTLKKAQQFINCFHEEEIAP